MSHLIKIFESIQRIKVLSEKRENDPLNQDKYEREIWEQYQIITNEKIVYYQERTYSKPEIKNAFVTFRSMEGK